MLFHSAALFGSAIYLLAMGSAGYYLRFVGGSWGTVMQVAFLFGLFLGGEVLAVHTAHEFKTCYEHFLRIKNLVESTPDLEAKVNRIRTGAGDQAIESKNGNRLRFIARSAGSGRGMSGDTVYLGFGLEGLSPAARDDLVARSLTHLTGQPRP